MLNRNEKLEIAKRLRLSTESEMSRDDLEKLLEEELTKPDAEMDATLVQMILELLEDGPSEEEQHDAWQQIENQLSSKRRWQPALNMLARIAAIGVILLAVMFTMYGTARAFNWEFLLRWMRPFAETFMLYSGDLPEATAVPAPSEVYSDAVSDIAQTEFTSLADCPDEIAGYPAKPVWMPERFAYVQSSYYADAQMSSITHLYQCDDGVCIVDVIVYNPDNGVNSYSYEQTNSTSYTTNVAGYDATYYKNNEGGLISAAWMDEAANYSINGSLSEEELTTILTTMMKQ